MELGRFITVFTRNRYWSLSQMNSDLVATVFVSEIQINIPSLRLGLPSGVFLQVFRPKYF
jgi:hypothetical protein